MRLLIPVDGSPYSAAALEFIAARPFGEGEHPQIDLLNVQLPVPPRAGRAVGAEFVRALHEAESSKVLKPALSVLRAAHLDPAWYYRVGNPAVEIVEWAELHGTDLIVIGSHGHTALKALAFGSVTQRVLASTTVPMLVLRTAKPPRRASLRVGIALDGSAYGIAAARFVLTHPRLFGPRPIVTLIHVAEPTAEEMRDSGRSRAPGARPSPAAAAAIASVLDPVREQFAQAGIAVHEHGRGGDRQRPRPGARTVRAGRNRRARARSGRHAGRGNRPLRPRTAARSAGDGVARPRRLHRGLAWLGGQPRGSDLQHAAAAAAASRSQGGPPLDRRPTQRRGLAGRRSDLPAPSACGAVTCRPAPAAGATARTCAAGDSGVASAGRDAPSRQARSERSPAAAPLRGMQARERWPRSAGVRIDRRPARRAAWARQGRPWNVCSWNAPFVLDVLVPAPATSRSGRLHQRGPPAQT